MITLNVETLRNGSQRVTSRIEGRTVKYKDVAIATKADCTEILRAAASDHQAPSGVWDMTYIRFNAAAAELMA